MDGDILMQLEISRNLKNNDNLSVDGQWGARPDDAFQDGGLYGGMQGVCADEERLEFAYILDMPDEKRGMVV